MPHGKEPTINQMLDAGREASQKIANRASQLINDFEDLQRDLENMKDIVGSGWETPTGQEPQRHSLRGNIDPGDERKQQEATLGAMRARLRSSLAEFDRAAEMLKQSRDAVAALVEK
jgi:hypothetical protein